MTKRCGREGGGLVYSTDVGRTCPRCRRAQNECRCEQRLAGKRPAGDGTVRVGLLPAGEVLSILHRGPRETLPKAYGKIARTAKENGFELTPPGRHVLLTAPSRAGREAALTEIQVPFRRGPAG